MLLGPEINTFSLSFFLGADPTKTKWFFGDKELDKSETYVFSTRDEGGKRILLRCEIKVKYDRFQKKISVLLLPK